jgi:hypothetical protein
MLEAVDDLGAYAGRVHPERRHLFVLIAAIRAPIEMNDR